MKLKEWDGELFKVTSELDNVEKLIRFELRPEKQIYWNLKVSVFQMQNYLGRVLARITNLSERRLALPTNERTLTHWAAVYAERVNTYYQKFAHVYGKKMWINLLKSRLSGSVQRNDLNFTDQDLIEMSMQRNRLQQLEKQLQRHRINLETKKGELQTRYLEQNTAIENRNAARSMHARYGQSLQEASSHPSIVGFQKLLGLLSKTMRSKTQSGQHVEAIARKVRNDVDSVIDVCRNQIFEEIRYPKQRRGNSCVNTLKGSLRKIEDLEQNISEASKLLMRNPNDAHPILVKNNLNRGRLNH